MSIYSDAAVVAAGEPSPVDPVTEKEMTAIDPDRLQILGKTLADRRDKWVAARAASGVEKRWKEDEDQYLGRDPATIQAASMMDAVKNGGPTARGNDHKVNRSTVFVNISRPKTNAAESRIANMLFSNEERPYGLKATPNPNLVKQAMAQAQQAQAPAAPQPAPGMGQAGMENLQPPAVQTPGQQPAAPMDTRPGQEMAAPSMAPMAQAPVVAPQLPPAPPDSARGQLEEANRRAKLMETEIHDALVETGFNAQARSMLHDCAVLGTGVMKGPIVVTRVGKAWAPVGNGGTHVLEFKKENRPASERVDPRNCFPDPTCGEDIHAGAGMFERKLNTDKQLRELVTQPGYMKDQIARVLAKGPDRPVANQDHDKRTNEATHGEKLYEVWEYWGTFAPEDLRQCGVDMPDDATESVSGCVIFVGDIAIKGFLNPLETGDIPYDFVTWEREEGTPWGFGVPYLCRPSQKVINAAWRQIMDNAALSVGPMVVYKPNLIQPADGSWQITGRKSWLCLDDSVDVRTAFSIFEMPNRSAEFQQIIELAMQFADEETSVPKLVQGEQNSTETVGGMTMLMNSANVVLSRLVKNFDDHFIVPHVRRYYDWMMAYSDKSDIKGDFQIEARGSSALLVRDMQQQALLQFGQFQGSPIIAPMVNWNNWLREVLKAQRIEATDIIKTEDEIRELQNAPPQPNPEEIKAKTAVEVAQIRAQAALDAANAREQGENAFAATQAAMARDNHVAKIRELELKRELELLKYANERQMSLDAVKADLAKTAVIEQTKRELAAAKMQLEATQSDKDRVQARNEGALNGND